MLYKTKTSVESRDAAPPVRAGIIPYTIFRNKIKLLFGVYKDTFELTDFGGGIQRGETPWQGAIREFFEESGGLMTCGKEEEHNFLGIRWAGSVIYFLPVSHIWYTSRVEKKHKPTNEILGLEWYDLDDLKPSSSLFRKIWSRIAFILKKSSKVLTVDNFTKVYDGEKMYFHVSKEE